MQDSPILAIKPVLRRGHRFPVCPHQHFNTRESSVPSTRRWGKVCLALVVLVLLVVVVRGGGGDGVAGSKSPLPWWWWWWWWWW